MLRLIICSALLTVFHTSAIAHEVVGIADGDTLTLLVDHRPLKIRLAGIDAPEKSQPWGQRSKESLSALCWGKDAQYVPETIDRYGRTVAIVRCNGVEANRAQVQSGMAWVYTQYNRDTSLQAIEGAARTSKRALWSDSHPTPPWEYRKNNSKSSKRVLY